MKSPRCNPRAAALALLVLAFALVTCDQKAAPTPCHTVTFSSQGGTAMPPIIVERGKTAIEPPPPTRQGYTFDGWRTNTTLYDFTKPITGNLTLYAQWKAAQPNTPTQPKETYTVSFDSQGGSDVAADTVEHGKTATEPTPPTRPDGPHGEQYSFEGWYYSSSGDVKFDFAHTAITDDLTLHAQWKAAQPSTPTQPEETYTVSFDSQGGSDVAADTVERGKTATEPTPPTRQGFAFGGWYTDAAATANPFDFKISITASCVLYARWTAAQQPTPQPGSAYIIIAFDSQGGSDVADDIIESGKAPKRPTDPIRPVGPHGEQYSFEGWYYSPSGGNKFDFNNAPPIIVSLKLYAQWAQALTVTFNSDFGTAIPPLAVASGKTAAEPTNPQKKEGIFDLAFEGWYDSPNGGSKFDFAHTPITANRTLFARYGAYLIYTEEQLKAVASNLTGHYQLQNDITLATANWDPLGNYNIPFTGRFEGGGHTIRNLNINSANNYAGLFGVVGASGKVEAVGLEAGSVKGINYVGGLAGSNYGSVSGYTIGGKVEGYNYVGGLVGYNNSTGTVVGYAAAAVEGGYSYVGGLVSYNEGTVVGYAVGKVVGGFNVGGLVGYNESAGKITGYARGGVARNSGSGHVEFGLVVGGNANTTTDAIRGYHSGTMGESQFSYITATQRKGYDGSAIRVNATIAEASYTGFSFRTNPGQWTFTVGRWPSINLEAPVDQSQITAP